MLIRVVSAQADQQKASKIVTRSSTVMHLARWEIKLVQMYIFHHYKKCAALQKQHNHLITPHI